MADYVQLGLSSTLGFPNLADGASGVLRFAAFAPDQTLLLKPNTGATGLITNWTLAYDLYIPGGQGTYAALLQTGVANTSDGDLFLKANSAINGGTVSGKVANL